MTKHDTLKHKRQYYHQLLVALGEEAHKETIVASAFGTTSTQDLNAKQLDSLIADAKKRLAANANSAQEKADFQVKKWRNKCLLVLNQRGIMAKPKDWSAVNDELAKKQYQWILTDQQREKGIVNHKGLYAFGTVLDLKKLFWQLAAIRDAEMKRNARLKELISNN